MTSQTKTGMADVSMPDAPPSSPAQEGFSTLLRWLASEISNPKLLDTQTFGLGDLKLALHHAVQTITEELDPDLLSWGEAARSKQYSINIAEDDLWRTRVVRWKDISGEDIERMDEARLEWYLKQARAEMRWIREEISRLKIHMNNASTQKENRERTSFDYHPSSRRLEECL